MTGYIVLRLKDGCYRDPRKVTASSADAAIRAALGKTGEAGTYVAIPERSFNPVAVKFETQTTIRLEQDKPESPRAAA